MAEQNGLNALRPACNRLEEKHWNCGRIASLNLRAVRQAEHQTELNQAGLRQRGRVLWQRRSVSLPRARASAELRILQPRIFPKKER